MKKLYEKNELKFALVWIGVYCVLQSLANPLNEIIGIENAMSAVFVLYRLSFCFLLCRKTGCLTSMGFVNHLYQLASSSTTFR